MSKFDHQPAQILLQHHKNCGGTRIPSPASQCASPGIKLQTPQKHSSMNQTPGTRLRLTALATGARQVEGIVVVAPRALGLRGRTYDPTSIGQPTYSRFSFRCCCCCMCMCMRISWVVGIRDMFPVRVETAGIHEFQSQLQPPL